jgi:ABC-type multidrug transport system ATPase subunit
MEIILFDVKYNDYNFSCTIKDNTITGITGSGKTTLLKLISADLTGFGDITYNGKVFTSNNLSSLKKAVSYVPSTLTIYPFLTTVEDYLKFYLKYYHLNLKDPKRKLLEALKIVGLNNSYYLKSITELSTSDTKLLALAIGLLTNPEVLLLDEPFAYLDLKNERKLYQLLLKLKDRYHKTIVIASTSSDLLYQYTTNLIILKNNKVLLEDITSSIYTNVPYLTKEDLEIPTISKFISLAKKKSSLLNYQKDIRDLIKDIYKHV